MNFLSYLCGVKFITDIFLVLLLAAYVIGALGCGRASESSSGEASDMLSSARESFSDGNYAKSVAISLQALDLASEAGDELLQAKIHELIADNYRSVYNLKVARIHRNAAIDSYRKAGRDKNAFYSTLDLAGEYSHENNDSAYIIMDLARGMLPDSASEMHDQFEFIYSDICRVLKDYNRAYDHYSNIDNNWLLSVLTSEDSVNIAEIYYFTNRSDSAFNYFDTPASFSEIAYWESMADWHESHGNYEKAVECMHQIRQISDDLTDSSISNALESVERAFYEQKAADTEREHRRFVSITAICVCVLIFAALMAASIRYYRKAKSLRAENAIKDVALSESQTELPDNTGSDHDERWALVILDFYMTRLNEISREYFKATTPDQIQDIETRFNKELQSLRNGDIFKEIEQRLNERNDDIAVKIRKAFPRFNEQYIRLMLCNLAGLSSQSVCLLLSIEKGNYYTMWTRIRARIRATDHPDATLFQSLFFKK